MYTSFCQPCLRSDWSSFVHPHHQNPLSHTMRYGECFHSFHVCRELPLAIHLSSLDRSAWHTSYSLRTPGRNELVFVKVTRNGRYIKDNASQLHWFPVCKAREVFRCTQCEGILRFPILPCLSGCSGRFDGTLALLTAWSTADTGNGAEHQSILHADGLVQLVAIQVHNKTGVH